MGAVFEWAGAFAKSLKAQLNIADKAYILTGIVDPTVTPTNAPVSSVFLRTVAAINTSYAVNGGGASTSPAAGKYGNVFTASATAPITSASILTGKTGSPTGNVFIEIWSVSGGLPNTLLYTSNAIAASALPAGAGNTVTFTFPTFPLLTSGTQYAMIYNFSGATSADVFITSSVTAPGFTGVSNGGGTGNSFSTTPGAFPNMSVTQTAASTTNMYQKQDIGATTNWVVLATGLVTASLEAEMNLRDSWNLSPYALAAANIVATQGTAQIASFSGTGPASYDGAQHNILFTSVGDQVVSINQLDANEFIAPNANNSAFGDLSTVDLTVYWKPGAVDTAATYELSRDGGVNYTTVSMTNAGVSTEAYSGTVTFATEQATTNTVATANGSRTTLDAASAQALAQPFVLSVASTAVTMSVTLHRDGSPAGNFYVQIWSSVAGAPGALIVSSQPQLTSGVGLGDFIISTTFNQSLAAGTYFVVVATDATYKATEVTGTTDIKWDQEAGTGGYAYNGTAWSTTGVAYTLSTIISTPSYQTLVTQNAVSDQSYTMNLVNIKAAQKFTVPSGAAWVAQQVTFNMTIHNTPVGNWYFTIVKDSAGSPSALGTDILASSVAIPVSTFSAGNNTVTLPSTPLQTGTTYWVVITPDATYEASAGVNQITLNSKNAGGVGNAVFVSGSWVVTGGDFIWTLGGRPLDLRVRITAGTPSVRMAAWGVFYAVQNGVVGGTLKLQRFQFNSVTDNLNSFTLTQFKPDPNLLKVIHVETGLTYVSGLWNLQGSAIVFPANFFNPDGVSRTVTLVADQNTGGSYSATDLNTQLLAANSLGSSDPTISKASPGRGIFLQRPDGTMREIAIDNTDSIVVYSV